MNGFDTGKRLAFIATAVVATLGAFNADDKMRKRASMKTASVYCVKRTPDNDEKRLAAQAAQAAAARKRAQAGQGQAQAQPTAAPPGMPREFFSGTTPKM